MVHIRGSAKFNDISQLLQDDLPDQIPRGAIIYCATRRHTEEVAQFLQEKGVAADFFYALLPPETKKHVQESFIEWLAERGRDVRRRQRGLLLLTARRAKGLEFDHVVVPDGNWNRLGKNEYGDAPGDFSTWR